MQRNVDNVGKTLVDTFCNNWRDQRDMGGKTGSISQRVPVSVTNKLGKLAQLTGWSQAEILSEMVWALSDYVAATGEAWFPFRIEADGVAAARIRQLREEHLALLREPDPERRTRMMVGMIPIPKDYFQPDLPDPSINEDPRPGEITTAVVRAERKNKAKRRAAAKGEGSAGAGARS